MIALLEEVQASAFGRKFVQIVHDMWTSGAKNNCLGAGLSFIDIWYKWHFIPCLLLVNNTSHEAIFNASLLERSFSERFKMDISKCAKFMGSDTTNAATAVSGHFDNVEQVNCEMHVLNLILLYGIGQK